jgi:hypothetical protein
VVETSCWFESGQGHQFNNPDLSGIFEAPRIGCSPQYGRGRSARTAAARPTCSRKFEFSFLNGNLMVPTAHRFIFSRAANRLLQNDQIGDLT